MMVGTRKSVKSERRKVVNSRTQQLARQRKRTQFKPLSC